MGSSLHTFGMLTSTVVGSLVLAVVAKGQIMFPGDDVYNHPKDTGRVTNLEVNRANENGQTTRLGTGAESTSDRNIKSIDDNSNSFGFGGNVISDYATGINLTDCTATNICNNISVTDYPNYAIIKALARMNKYTKSIVKSLAKTSHNSGRSDMDIHQNRRQRRQILRDQCLRNQEGEESAQRCSQYQRRVHVDSQFSCWEGGICTECGYYSLFGS